MDPDLCSIIADVITPALRRVLTSSEPTEVDARRIGPGPATGEGSVEVRVKVAGEELHDTVHDSRVPGTSLPQLADRLTSNLVDFVAESSFGWGQDRHHGPPSDLAP